MKTQNEKYFFMVCIFCFTYFFLPAYSQEIEEVEYENIIEEDKKKI